jgi:hypothetical protein
VTSISRVFVNGVGFDVPTGATALDAIRAWNADAAAAIVRGETMITDSRGLPTSPDAPVPAGAIFRVVPARSREAAARPRADEEL